MAQNIDFIMGVIIPQRIFLHRVDGNFWCKFLVYYFNIAEPQSVSYFSWESQILLERNTLVSGLSCHFQESYEEVSSWQYLIHLEKNPFYVSF